MWPLQGGLLIHFVLYGQYLIAINFGMHATLLPNGQALQRFCFEYVRWRPDGYYFRLSVISTELFCFAWEDCVSWLWPFLVYFINTSPHIWLIVVCHYENMPIQIYRKFYHHKNWKFLIKKSDIFHISAQKHRLWVLVEAVLTSTHNLCFWAVIRKIMHAAINLSFTI